jgi:hypothetical protein
MAYWYRRFSGDEWHKSDVPPELVDAPLERGSAQLAFRPLPLRVGDYVRVYLPDGRGDVTYKIVENKTGKDYVLADLCTDKDMGIKLPEEADVNEVEFLVELACRLGADEGQRETLRKVRRMPGWQDRLLEYILADSVVNGGMALKTLGFDEPA